MFTQVAAYVKRGDSMEQYLTIGEVAKRLGLEVDTIRKLERAGKIRASRTKGGHRRFTEDAIDRYRRSRWKTGDAKAKPGKHCRRVAPRRHPVSGEFVNRSVEFADDLEEFEEDFLIDDAEDDLYQPPQALPRPRPAQQVTPLALPKPAVFATAPLPARPAPPVDTGLADRIQLQSIRGYGRSAIPWDVPADWRGKVIAELERFVTPIQFPPDLPFNEAVNIVRARVAEVLQPHYEAEEKDKRDKKAREEADRRRAALVAHGNAYARRDTSDWDWSASYEARDEVKKVLEREVEHDWTEREVENAVDQVLDEWDDGDDEE
jgi:excisionase family DNA binding protein